MKKQAHDHLIDYYKEFIPRIQRELFERQRQSDSVIVWLTAISTASIGLLITNSDSILITNTCYFKFTVAFLLLSVISGALFRIYLYPLEDLQSNLILSFEAFCYGASLETDGPRKLSDTDTIEDIAKYLKEDMGFDYDNWLEHEYLDRDFWVEHYNSWAEFWEKSEQDGLKALGRNLAPLSNKKPEETENIFIEPQDNTAEQKMYTRLLLINSVAYQLSLLCFSMAVFTIGLGYILE